MILCSSSQVHIVIDVIDVIDVVDVVDVVDIVDVVNVWVLIAVQLR